VEKFGVWFHMKVKPGRVDDLMAIYDEQFAEFAGQKHTEVYALHRGTDDPNEFWAYELFTSRDAFEEHRSTRLVRRHLPVIVELCDVKEHVTGVPIRALGLDV
jgi:quinol monooxygenase YgiN